MPTPEELDQFGAGLSIWEQLRLFQEWSPLIGFAQRFTLEKDSYARSVVVSEALKWVASKTRSRLDDEAYEDYCERMSGYQRDGFTQAFAEQPYLP